MYAPETLELITSAAHIEDVVADAVTLKKSGSNLVGLCPFHNDQTPSFTVFPKTNTYKCFGCGVGGDAISFLTRQGKTFPEAVSALAKKYGVEIAAETPEQAARWEQKTLLRTALLSAQRVFETRFDATKSYWAQRGFADETISIFGLGWVNGQDLDDLKKTADPKTLQEAGLLSEKGHSALFNRYTIPIHDASGQLVAFAGRAPSDEPKYLNTRRTDLYDKGRTLYNLHRAARHIRESRTVYITEGYPDTYAMWEEGYPGIVAVGGTALTEGHVAALKRAAGEGRLRAVLVFNGDGAGQKAATAAFPLLLRAGIETRIVTLPEGKDICDIRASKKHDLAGILAGSEDAIELAIKKRFREDLSPIELAEIQTEIAQILALVSPDNARDIYINRLANNLAILPKKLSELVDKYRTDTETAKAKKTEARTEEVYIKVCNNFFEKQVIYDPLTKSFESDYVLRGVKELERELGARPVKMIPRYNNWTVEPSHTDFRRVILANHEGLENRLFNRYHPLPHKPKPFDLPKGWEHPDFDYGKIPEIANTAHFYKHLYDHPKHGNRYLALGWDYFAVMYLHPFRRLQARAFVSSEEGTGKSTVYNYEQQFFGRNATKTTSKRLLGNFNADLADKVLIAIEETKDERGGMENDLKDLITGFDKVVEVKFQDARRVRTFEKYLFLSNHPETFMKVSSGTTRFAVMKVPVIEVQDNALLEKMILEIPYTMHFLERRGVITPDTNRLWFDPALWENEALMRLRHASKDISVQGIEELIQDVFVKTDWREPYLKYSSSELRELMFMRAGKKYGEQTTTYFAQICRNQMGMPYRDKPSSFSFPHITRFVIGDKWDWEIRTDKDRHILFPVWMFFSPAELVELIPDRAEVLIEKSKALPDKPEGLIKWLKDSEKIKVEAAKSAADDTTDLPF